MPHWERAYPKSVFTAAGQVAQKQWTWASCVSRAGGGEATGLGEEEEEGKREIETEGGKGEKEEEKERKGNRGRKKRLQTGKHQPCPLSPPGGATRRVSACLPGSQRTSSGSAQLLLGGDGK